MSRLIRLPLFSSVIFLLLLGAGHPSSAQIADFTSNPTSGCAPLVVQFSDLSSGAITSYSWNLGTATSTLQNPSTTYTAPGVYPISLTVTGAAGSHTKTSSITVYDKPAVSFVAATAVAGCTPHNVQFNSTVTANSPGTATYNWDFGDGNTDTIANPLHTYVTAGTYTVILTVTNGAGCIGSAIQNAYITAHPLPVPAFSAAQTYFCSTPAVATFTNTSTGGASPYTTAWDFGDGNTGTGNNVSHTYNAGGSFTVTMVVTDSKGCSSTLTRTSYIGVNATLATFSGPATVCDEVEASFFNTTSGATSTSWDFGDGYTTSGSSGVHLYAGPGTYTVTMTTTFSGCTKSVAKSLTVNPKPTATITISPGIPCPKPVTVTFTGNSSVVPVTKYVWSWASGGADSGQTVSKNYIANIQDIATLITTSAAGCKDTVRMDTVYIRDILVHIVPGPLCMPDVYAGCIPLKIDFHVDLYSSLPVLPLICNFVLYPFQANTYLWDFDDGSSPSTLATPSHTFTNVGDYYVKCIITTPNGCRDTAIRWVHSDTKVKPSFTASPLVVCQNEPITIVNTTDTPLSSTSYLWEITEPYIPYDTTLTIKRFDTGSVVFRRRYPGTYTVRMYSDHNGCRDTFSRNDYVVVNPPDAKFYDSVYCSPSTTVKFTNISIGATSVLWDFGDGDTSTAYSPVHTYALRGVVYRPKLIVYNSIYGCSDTMISEIILFTPSLDISVSDSTICVNESVLFEGHFYGHGEVAYAWLLDNTPTPFDTSKKIAYKYTTRGYHDVTLYVASGRGCIDTLFMPARILAAQPDVVLTATPPIGCAPLNIVFGDSSTNVPGVKTASRTWIFGPGDTVTNNQATITRSYAHKDSLTIQLIVTDSLGCISDLHAGYKDISVHEPIATFTANDTSVCVNGPVIFRDTSADTSGRRYLWSFGDGNTLTGNPATHRYSDTGQFSVQLIVTDSVGCMDTLVRSNYIVTETPRAGFTMSDSIGICPTLLVKFTNTSTGAVSYLWNFGAGGSPVIVTNPVNTYSTSGLYYVYLVATNINGCTDTARDTVRVLGYKGAFSYLPINGCAPMEVRFSTPITGIPLITWDFGDGVTSPPSAATAITHIYPSPGAYVPKVIFSNGQGCSSSSVGLDTIKADKLNADFRWSVPCAGVAFSLSDNSSALFSNPVAWTWLFSAAAGDTANGSPVTHTFSTPGNHPVTLIAATAAGCKDTITKQVLINDLPLVRAPDDTGVCPGDKAILVAKGAVSYVWSPAAAVRCLNPPACDSVEVGGPASPDVPDRYAVTGTDANGCVNKDSTEVRIQLRATSSTGPGGEICVGESFRLFAAGATAYEWMPAETIDSPLIASPLATPQNTTTYIVAAMEGTCDVDSQRVQVIVRSLPVFSAGQDEIISLGSAVTLRPTQSGITSIVWRADTTLSCLDCFRPNASPHYTTVYYATGYNEYGCGASDSVTVHVRCNGSLVFIPNSFTPNGDGLNDYFFPRGEGIRQMSVIRVYNRWGEVVYERNGVALNDERGGWDGTYKGKALPPDVYVYTMQSRCETGEPISWKGDVAIIR